MIMASAGQRNGGAGLPWAPSSNVYGSLREMRNGASFVSRPARLLKGRFFRPLVTSLSLRAGASSVAVSLRETVGHLAERDVYVVSPLEMVHHEMQT